MPRQFGCRSTRIPNQRILDAEAGHFVDVVGEVAVVLHYVGVAELLQKLDVGVGAVHICASSKAPLLTSCEHLIFSEFGWRSTSQWVHFPSNLHSSPVKPCRLLCHVSAIPPALLYVPQQCEKVIQKGCIVAQVRIQRQGLTWGFHGVRQLKTQFSFIHIVF